MRYDGEVVIGTKLDTKSFDAQIDQVESKLKDVESLLKMASKDKTLFSTREIQDMEAEAEKLKNQLIDLRKKQSDLNGRGLKDVSEAMSDVLKKVAKWGLAVFSIRSVYAGIRKIMSTLTQYNQTLASNLQYLQFAVSMAFEKIVNWIVKAITNLIVMIGRFIYLLTGKNIFKNSGIDDFDKALKSSANSAKEIKKTLAGFDEMNVLQKDGSVSSTGGIGGSLVDLPDLSKEITKVTNFEKAIGNLTNKWFDLGEEMKKALIQPETFTEAYGYWSTFVKGVVKLFYGIWEVITGLSEFLGGLIEIIVGVFTLDANKILEGWEFVKKGIADIFNGLLDIVSGIIEMIIGLVIGLANEVWSGITGLFTLIINGIIGLWEGILRVISIIAGWVDKNIIQPIARFIGTLISDIIRNVTTCWATIVGIIVGIASWVNNNIIQPIINFLKNLWSNITSGVSSSWNGVKNTVSSVANWINNNVIQPIVNFFKTGFTTVSNTIKSALDPANFSTAFNNLKNSFSNLWSNIKSGASSAWSKIKSVFGFSSGGVTTGFANGGVVGFANGGLTGMPKQNVIKMASGSVISQPGRGVPITRAIGGEAGHEGILPLTNAQMMSQLGKEIGQNVSIDLTNIFKVDSRQLARIQKIVNAQNDFAFNR